MKLYPRVVFINLQEGSSLSCEEVTGIHAAEHCRHHHKEQITNPRKTQNF